MSGKLKVFTPMCPVRNSEKKGDHILGEAKWSVSGVLQIDYVSIQAKIKEGSASQYNSL